MCSLGSPVRRTPALGGRALSMSSAFLFPQLPARPPHLGCRAATAAEVTAKTDVDKTTSACWSVLLPSCSAGPASGCRCLCLPASSVHGPCLHLGRHGWEQHQDEVAVQGQHRSLPQGRRKPLPPGAVPGRTVSLLLCLLLPPAKDASTRKPSGKMTACVPALSRGLQGPHPTSALSVSSYSEGGGS